MVSEARKQSMAWMETDYSKHTYFRWKVKWRLEHLGALGTMGEAVPLRLTYAQKEKNWKLSLQLRSNLSSCKESPDEAPTGFEPMTSAIPRVRCSTNWAMKPRDRPEWVQLIPFIWNDVYVIWIPNSSSMNRDWYREWISANVLQTAKVYWWVPVFLSKI